MIKKQLTICIFIMIIFFTTACDSRADTEIDAPKRLQDKEFVSDSGIKIQDLSSLQQENLYVLAKVWGFSKYRHPQITAGQINWDAELFRIMPKILKAKCRSAARDIMANWLEKFPFKLEELESKKKEQFLKNASNNYLRLDDSWISDKSLLGERVSKYLQKLSKVKVGDTSKGYASFGQNAIGLESPAINVSNDADTGNNMKYDDSAMRLLGLFRYWNIIEYFFPYKNLMNEDWDKILYDKIPELALGKDQESYTLSMANLTTYIHDSHGFVTDKHRILNDYFGYYRPNIRTLNVNGKIVVVYATEESKLKPGDILLSINGTTMETRLKKCRKYIAVSNDDRFSQSFSKALLGSKKEQATVRIIRNTEKLNLIVPCAYNADGSVGIGPDSGVPSGLRESGRIGYLNIETAEQNEIDGLMAKFKNTEGIIIDLRYGRPDGMFWALAEYIKPKVTKFNQFYGCNSFEPGSFLALEGDSFSGKGYLKGILESENMSFTQVLLFSTLYDNGMIRTLLGHVKERPFYDGEIVLLMNEYTLSQPEYAIMALRDAPRAIVMGTPSAGADGDIVEVNLPGQITTYFSGLAVTYPDGTQTQRVGLQPDAMVKPTVQGLIDGRDELMEAAILLIKED